MRLAVNHLATKEQRVVPLHLVLKNSLFQNLGELEQVEAFEESNQTHRRLLIQYLKQINQIGIA